jgi:hypothetical protein
MDGLDGGRVDMVLDPLAERVGEPREAAYRHVDGQIMALDHRGRDVRWIRGSFDPLSHGGDDLGRAVAGLAGRLRRLAVDFDELGVVDIRAEGVFDRLEIGPVSVGC